MRFALKAALWSFVGLVLALGGAVLLLDSAPGRRLAERVVNARLADVVQIEGLEDGLFGQIRLRRIELRDSDGVWAEARDVALAWRPAALLAGALAVDSAAIGEAVLHRPPVAAGRAEGGGLPLRVELDRFSIAILRLADAAPGGPAILSLEGSGGLAGDEDFQADVVVRRIDAEGVAFASLRSEGGVHQVTGALEEPPEGLLARLLGIEDAPRISLSFEGRGPLDDFDLTFEGGAGEMRISGRAELRRGERGLDFAAQASGELAAFLPTRLRPLAEGGATLSAAGLVSDDGSAQLRSLEAQVGPFALSGSGALDAAGGLVGRIEASGPLAPIAEVAAAEGAGDWRLTADLRGSLALPGASWRLDLSAPRLDGFAARSLALVGDVGLGTDAVRFEASATADAPSAPQASLPETISAHFAGDFQRETGDVTVRRVALDGGPYVLEARGRIAGTGEAALDLEASARNLDALGARGRAEVDGALSGPLEALEGRLDLRLAGLSLRRPELDAALGPAPRATAEFRRQGDALRIDRLAIRGERATLEGSGAVSAERVVAELSLRLPALAALGSLVAGAASLKASLSGRPDALAGPVSLVAEFGEATLTAEGRFGMDDKAFALRGLRLGGTGLDGGGDVSAPRTGGAPEGRLDLRVAELRPWAALLDVALAGSVGIETRLAGGGLRVEARATSLEIGDAASIATASLSARLDDLSDPRGSIVATAADATIAGAAVRLLRLDAKPTGAAATFRLRAEAAELDLDAAGEIAWSDGERLTLNRLEGRAIGQPVRLVGPATLARRGALVTLAGLELAFGEGRIGADARLDAGRVDGRLTASAFPLAPFLGEAARRLDGELKLAGAAAEPEADLQARLTAGRADLPTELADVALAIRGAWRGGRATLTAELAGAPGTTARANLELPLQGNFIDWSFAAPPEGAVRGGLDATADLAALAPFLPLDGHRVAGRFQAALRVSGSVANPAVAGEAALSEGRYDGHAFGTALRDIDMRLRGDGRRIALERISANDGAGGVLDGAGELQLEAGRVETRVSFTRLRVASSDELRAIASGALRLSGPLATTTLSGEVEIHEAEYAIPRRLPTRIAELDVIEVNVPPGREPRRREGDARGSGGGGAFDPGLELLVRAPGQIFVRGRGLDSEWAGEVRIGGRLSDPEIGGALRVVRGQFSLAGRALRLTGGSVTFPDRGPGREEPELDVTASTPAGAASAELRLSGPVSALEVSLSSQPPLPQDEILSRLLFGTGAASLGPAQALQLAQTALELSGRGGSGGMLGDIRQRFGLDFLDIETAEGGEGLDAARLRAGKYVRDDVYVGVRQGARAGSSSAVVEYEFLPSLSLEGSVGADSQAGVGLNWERRY